MSGNIATWVPEFVAGLLIGVVITMIIINLVIFVDIS
jgi:hypothetical protein